MEEGEKCRGKTWLVRLDPEQGKSNQMSPNLTAGEVLFQVLLQVHSFSHFGVVPIEDPAALCFSRLFRAGQSSKGR